MHLSNLVLLLPLALLPLVTADSGSGDGSWSIRGSTTKDEGANPDNPDLYEELGSGRNVVDCADLSNGEEIRLVKGTPGDFVVTVYRGPSDADDRKCAGEGATIQPGEVYVGKFTQYEVKFLPPLKRRGKVLESWVA